MAFNWAAVKREIIEQYGDHYEKYLGTFKKRIINNGITIL
jgi:hypothetical protein